MADRRLVFVVDTAKCVNCRTCEIACKDVHNAGPGVRMRRVRSFETGEFPSVVVVNYSMACNHCDDPVCLSQCPARAYSKRDDGIVVHDESRCIGCRYCTWVCPYGAPQYDEANGCIRKCDMCVGELESGRPPACVEACPTRAIAVRWTDELDIVLAEQAIANLPAPEITKPGTRYLLKKEARNG